VNNPHPVPYSIKRHGTNFHDCAAEPIRAPGCIQPHGALLVLRSVDLTILQVSENSPQLFGLTAEQLLGKNIDVLLDGASIPNVSPANAKMRLAVETWKRTPYPLTRLIGPALTRYLP